MSSAETMTKFDVTHWPLSVEKVLTETTNPHHRAILRNFLRHLTLEISGRWEEILEPQMTVRHPYYRMVQKGKTLVLDGMDAVAGFYREIAEGDLNVMGSIEEALWVSDAGVAAESFWGHIYPGTTLTTDDVPDLDPEAHYLVTFRLAYTFRYDAQPLLLGEYIYDDPDSYTYTKLDPADVTTTEEAAALLEPILERVEATS